MDALPFEVISTIFVSSKDDPCCLFSCLLVNRTWTRLVVPILWTDPFAMCRTCRFRRRHTNLIDTIINLLSKKLDEGVQNPWNRQQISSSKTKEPFFRYLSHIRRLDDNFVNRSMIFWHYSQPKPPHFRDSYSLFFQFLIEETDHLISLKITPNYYSRQECSKIFSAIIDFPY
jgi:hypothetical protein